MTGFKSRMTKIGIRNRKSRDSGKSKNDAARKKKRGAESAKRRGGTSQTSL
jgi:hypothetical protein